MLGLTLATVVATGIPFTLADHRIFVQASIGRAGPFSLIVDTGSSGLLLTPDVIRRVGIRAIRAGYVSGAGAGEVAAARATIRGLRVGDTQFPTAPAVVADLSPIARAIGFNRLDGVIGYEQLKRYRMFVDVDRHRITFTPTPLHAPANATTTPFTIHGGLIYVDAAVDGVHGSFLVDTGDRSQLTLFRPFADANDFRHFATVHNVVTGYGIGGPVYADLLRTTLDALGATAFDVKTRAALADAGAFAAADRAGSIGNGFLERFNLVYDYPDRRIVAWPALHPPADTSLIHLPAIPNAPASPLGRHALFGAAAALKPAGVTLTFVAQNGAAAAAGLRAGDVLRSIAGRSIVSAAAYYQAIHDAAADRSIDVLFVRDGVTHDARVTLAAAPDETESGVNTLYQQIVVDNSLRRTIVTVPDARGRLPAVLVLGGIGCLSVDVAANPQDPYLRLTHDLARAGYIGMRLEKSGVGDSQGPPCANVDYESEVRGYEAALAALRANPLVDPKRVYLFGHSIGTIIAPRLALQGGVAGIVVAEAVARDWPEYEIRNLRRQLELGGDSPATVDAALLEKAQCMQKLLFQYEPEAEIEDELPSCKVHNGVYPVAASYMQQVAHLNATESWMHVGVPVLAIYGTSDFVTEKTDHERIVAVVNGTHAGLASLVTIDGMSHLLTEIPSPQEASVDFDKGITAPYDEQLSVAVVRWLDYSVSTGRLEGR